MKDELLTILEKYPDNKENELLHNLITVLQCLEEGRFNGASYNKSYNLGSSRITILMNPIK